MSIRPRPVHNAVVPNATGSAVSNSFQSGANAPIAKMPGVAHTGSTLSAANNGYVPSPALQQSMIESEVAAARGLPAPVVEFENLSRTEQAVAALGVSPNAIKPIEWLNEAHKQQLLKNNSLDPHLARRLEAFAVVSAASAEDPFAGAPGRQ